MNRRLRILSFIVMTYMLAALCWWAVLLYRKNTEVFKLESQLLQEKYINDLGIPSLDVTTLPEFELLHQSFNRQMNMIMGEAVVFGFVLILGIYFINRAFNKELAVAERQQNFLLSITHELKSPLASINLILDTFIKRSLPQDKIEELSNDALKESTRLDNLFNKILLATRLDQAYQYIYQEINFSAFLKSETEKFQRVHTDVKIRTDITENITLKIDENGFLSVINNLLENAVKYNIADPKEIEIELKLTPQRVVLIINDNGIGLESKEFEKIFDQFYRVGPEDTRTSKGTGLGLYIVRQIVKAHKGKISVASSQLGGSRFEIVLPK